MTSYNPDAGSLPGTDAYTRFKPIYFLCTRYYIGNRIAIGAGIAVHAYENAYYNRYFDAQVYFFQHVVNLCVDMKLDYFNKGIFQAYGMFSGGAFIYHDKSTYISISNPNHISTHYYHDVTPAIYLSPFGIRVGKKYAGFAEAGIGYKGLINCGLSVKL